MLPLLSLPPALLPSLPAELVWLPILDFYPPVCGEAFPSRRNWYVSHISELITILFPTSDIFIFKLNVYFSKECIKMLSEKKTYNILSVSVQMLQCTREGQRTPCVSQFSPSTAWVLETELRPNPPGLVTSMLTCWIISLAPEECFTKCKYSHA